MSTFDQIAPYPRSEHEATAKAMGRSFAVHAQVHWRMAIEHPEQEKARESARWVGQYFALAYLLRELQQRSGKEAADKVARDLWAELDAVAGMGGWVWHWLTEYGVNKTLLNQVIDDLMAEPSPSPAGVA